MQRDNRLAIRTLLNPASPAAGRDGAGAAGPACLRAAGRCARVTRGFTILEMLIAMVVSIIMLGVISRLFFDTANAIGQGAAMSQIIANSRAVGDQLNRDTQAIVGPDEGGFIVIVNQIIPNVAMKTRTGGEIFRPVRADQLVFIRKTDGMEHIAPATDQSFAPSDPQKLNAPYARVWYGHIERTQPDGSDSLDLGVNNPTNPNRVGTNWILGRQALMLSENLQSGINIFVNGAEFNSPVNLPSTIPFSKVFYMGLTDVSNVPLSDIDADLSGAANYKTQAYNYAFVGPWRLRANPTPDKNTFESWQIGQMHPIFMENVSDFVVEFAADVADDAAIPGFPDGEPDMNAATGNVEWYGLGHVPAAADWTGNYPLSPGSPYAPINANDVRWVFRHDYGENWPYMIRIRYRLHDPNGRFEEYVGASSTTGAAESGQWFEQIFRVR